MGGARDETMMNCPEVLARKGKVYSVFRLFFIFSAFPSSSFLIHSFILLNRDKQPKGLDQHECHGNLTIILQAHAYLNSM